MSFFTKKVTRNTGWNGQAEEVTIVRVDRIVLAVIAVIIVVAMLFSSITTIPTGHTGVLSTFGKVENYTLESGVHFKSPIQRVIKMNNQVQKATVELSCFSSDIQEVSMMYTLNYKIDHTNAMNIYKTVGKNYYDKIVTPCITEAVKVVTAQYTAEKLVSNRSELAMGVEEELATRLGQYNIQVVSTSIEDFDFTDAFTNAVEAKQVAEQNKLRAETEAEQARVEAQAKADVRLIETKAEAEAKLIEAEATAEANRKVSQSLTDEILDKMYYETWNGVLPSVMGSDSTIIKEIAPSVAE